MQLFPAIDLRGGRCVRLYQGDYGRETVYGDDPVAQATAFAAAGAGSPRGAGRCLLLLLSHTCSSSSCIPR